MSESVIDFAGLDVTSTATTTETVETPSTETTETVETPSTETTGKEKTETKEEGKEKTQYDSSGQPVKEAEIAKDEDLPGTEKTPQEIRQALKALRDSDPKHAAAVKQLHGAFERYEAMKQIFNTSEDLKSHNQLDALGKLAPSFLDAVKANDSDGYYTAFAPHFLSGLELV